MPLISVGDRFASHGREHALWGVDKVQEVPRKGAIAYLAQVGGGGRVKLSVSDLAANEAFMKIAP